MLPTVRALARSDNGLDALFAYQHGEAWHALHSHDVNEYIAGRAGGHFTAKEFRTWNATVLMALMLANAGRQRRPRPAASGSSRPACGRWRAGWATPRRWPAASYIDPRLIDRYESAGELATIPAVPPSLPAPAEAEQAVAELLARLHDGEAERERPASTGKASPARATLRNKYMRCVAPRAGMCDRWRLDVTTETGPPWPCSRPSCAPRVPGLA